MNFLSPETIQTLELAIYFIAVIVLAFIVVISLIAINDTQKLKKQSVIDSGIISRDNVRLTNNHQEIGKLKAQIEHYKEVIDKLLVKSISQNIDLEVYRSKPKKNFKSAFEDAVNELKIVNDERRIAYERIASLSEGIVTITNNRNYWKERALHEKHTVKELDSELWECTDIHLLPFEKGKIYEMSKRKTKISSVVYMKNAGKDFLVLKSSFNPVN